MMSDASAETRGVNDTCAARLVFLRFLVFVRNTENSRVPPYKDKKMYGKHYENENAKIVLKSC